MNTLLAAFVTTLVSWAQPQAPDRVVTVEQTLCLTEAVYFESRGEEPVGLAAAAYVVLNRTVKRNASICRVVHEPDQFSYYVPHHPKHVREGSAWMQSAFIALYAQLGLIENPIGNATYYNTKKMRSWTNMATLTGHIHHHYFYTQNEDLQTPALWTIRPNAIKPSDQLQISCFLTGSDCVPSSNLAQLNLNPNMVASLESNDHLTIQDDHDVSHHHRTHIITKPIVLLKKDHPHMGSETQHAEQSGHHRMYFVSR